MSKMAWFRNHHQCYRCALRSTTCQPVDSDDLTFVVDEEHHSFVVLRSSDVAEHEPDYREVLRFLTKDLAEAFASKERKREISAA